ncbi:hypothetical protein [Paralcaligenes ginsengisoli]
MNETDRLNFVLAHYATQFLEIAYCQHDHTTLYRVPGTIPFYPTARDAIDGGIAAEKLKGLL